MPTLRVFQVAKLLKVESEEIFDALSDMGISVSSNLAPLDEAVVSELKELFKPKPQAVVKVAAEKKAAAPPSVKKVPAPRKAARRRPPAGRRARPRSRPKN
jgi:hypothetical protein